MLVLPLALPAPRRVNLSLPLISEMFCTSPCRRYINLIILTSSHTGSSDCIFPGRRRTLCCDYKTGCIDGVAVQRPDAVSRWLVMCEAFGLVHKLTYILQLFAAASGDSAAAASSSQSRPGSRPSARPPIPCPTYRRPATLGLEDVKTEAFENSLKLLRRLCCP